MNSDALVGDHDLAVILGTVHTPPGLEGDPSLGLAIRNVRSLKRKIDRLGGRGGTKLNISVNTSAQPSPTSDRPPSTLIPLPASSGPVAGLRSDF